MPSPIVVPGADLGLPPIPAGKTFQAARVIGTAFANDTVFAFVLAQATDRTTTLCLRTCVNGVWVPDWTSLTTGAPDIDFDASGQGTVFGGPGGLFIFVAGTDGAVHCAFGNFLAWAWQRVGTPPGLTVKFVDNVLFSPFGIAVKASDGACWFAAPSGALWLWASTSSTFFMRTDSLLPLTISGQFVIYFHVDAAGHLRCAALVYTGIASNGMVKVGVEYSSDSGVGSIGKYSTPPTLYVRARNPDGSFVQSKALKSDTGTMYLDQIQTFVINLTEEPGFQPYAVCWMYAQGGKMGYYYDVGDRESAANFNYVPDSGPRGVSYFVGQKGWIPAASYASFSSCSNFP